MLYRGPREATEKQKHAVPTGTYAIPRALLVRINVVTKVFGVRRWRKCDKRVADTFSERQRRFTCRCNVK